MLSFFWNTLLKTPLINLLFLFTHLVGNNLGWGILLFTLFLQFLLVPLRLPQLKTSQKMKKMKPELDGLRNEHKDDKVALAQAQMDLYKKHGVSPLGGFAPTVISLIILLALYRVLFETIGAIDITPINSRLYFDFLKLSSLESLKTNFLWLNIGEPDRFFVLPVLVGASQWLMTKATAGFGKKEGQREKKEKGTKDGEEGKTGEGLEDMMASLQGQMLFIFPLMSALIVARLPSGVGLYWMVGVWFAIIQQKVVKG